MSDDKFDAIVVGAGVAGSVAALVMARAGLDVLVIERGDSAGCKNMTGGRLYAHTLEAIIPGFAVSAPVERKVTREKISFLTEESAVTLDFHREQPDVPQHASYTVLRNRLDPWLMEQAEQAGAQFIPGVRVDALVREGNKVTGVQAGDDILEANVVILAMALTRCLAARWEWFPLPIRIITLLVLKRLLASHQNRSTIALILRARKVPPGCLPVPLLTA